MTSERLLHGALPAISYHGDTEDVAADLAVAVGKRWAPHVRLHPATHYPPIAGSDYVAHAAAPFDNWHAILATPRSGYDVRLAPDVGALREAGRVGAIRPTVHAIVRRFTGAGPLHGCLLVYYLFLYANQPDARLFGCCWRLPDTGHVADLEWVVALLDPTGERRLWTFYSAHGNAESSWVPAGRARQRQETRPDVYVALDTQANFPTPGRKNRIWFAVADVCAPSDRAPQLDYALEIMPPEHPFRRFAGVLGPDGIGGPGRGDRLDLPSTERNHIDTAFRRRMFRCS